MIRPLDPLTDLPALAEFSSRAADYILLETGQPPTPDWGASLFTDGPPGTPAEAHRQFGLFENGQLMGIAAMIFGWPEPRDAYLGLMLLDPQMRGRGLGPQLLNHVIAEARANAAPRLLIAVLDSNPKGRAFWERQGFRHLLTLPPRQYGSATHVPHRMELRL